MEQIYSLFLQHPVVTTDSRNCPKGSLFFALRGDKFDANAFAKSALENGAAYAIIDNPQYAENERYILVEDSLLALQQLAKKHREMLGTTIIGVTGTNGKTTTKELLNAVLKQKFKTHYTKGNLNNHIGVPLTLLQLEKSHEIAIVEMGANHLGEIELLANIVKPDFGLITNVGKAHLEGFGNFEGVKKAKAELYQNIKKSGKKIFIQSGNSDLVEMAIEVGIDINKEALHYAISNKLNDHISVGEVLNQSFMLQMKAKTSEGEFQLNTQLIGEYNAENFIAAIAVGHHFGVANNDIKMALESYKPSNNRSQWLQTTHNNLIVDAYNANPSSMQLAVNNFAKLDAKNKMLILGDMLEMGESSINEHRHIIQLLEHNNLEKVYLVGSNFASISSKFSTFVNIDKLIEELKEKPIKDHTILLKGSNGIGLTKATQYL